MIKSLLWKIVCMIMYLIFSSFLMVQLAYWLSFKWNFEAMKNAPILCFDYRIIWWQGNNDYFYLAGTLILLGLIAMISLSFLKNKNSNYRKEKRRLKREEKVSFAHRASRHEAKKGLVRLQFNKYIRLNHIYYNKKDYKNTLQWWVGTIDVVIFMFFFIMLLNNGIQKIGNLFSEEWIFRFALFRNHNLIVLIGLGVTTIIYLVLAMPVCDMKAFEELGNTMEENGLFRSGGYLVPHFRDLTDFIFNPLKHYWNVLMGKLKRPDITHFNELKYWTIDGHITCRRAGIPIITSKRMIWVHAEDNHSSTIGTTNSGKTWSEVLSMIVACGMSGHCMIINDLKGELFDTNSGYLRSIGYNVRAINFRDPEHSDCWNPFGVVIQTYRKEQLKFWNSFTDDKLLQDFIDAKKEFIELNQLIATQFKTYEEVSAKQKKNKENKELQYKAIVLERQIKENTEKAKKVKNYLEEMIEQDKVPHANYSEAWEYLQDIVNTLCKEKDAKQPFFWQQAALIMRCAIQFLLEYEYIGDDGNIHYLDDNQINFENVKNIRKEGFEIVLINGKRMALWQYWLSTFRLSTDKSVDAIGVFSGQASESMNDVLKTLDTKLDLGTMNENISKMLSRNTFSFDEIAEKKTAIFLIVHDEKDTYYPFTNIFINQFYIQLIKTANETEKNGKGGKLPIPLDVIWDEFGISPAIAGVKNMFSACRSRGVRWHIVMQNTEQLTSNYGKEDASTIRSNVVDNIFLLGDNESAKRFSQSCGTMLKWNDEQNHFDTVPCFSENELMHLSLSEAVTNIQRKNAFKTRFLGFDKYIYYDKLKTIKSEPLENKLKPFNKFSLNRETDKMYQRIGKELEKKKKDNEKEEVKPKTKKSDIYKSGGKDVTGEHARLQEQPEPTLKLSKKPSEEQMEVESVATPEEAKEEVNPKVKKDESIMRYVGFDNVNSKEDE